MFYQLPNGKSFAHVSRSCTSTLCAHALKQFYPDAYEKFRNSCQSPQRWLNETWANRLPPHCLVMARNPIDRLNSVITRNSYSEEKVQAVLESCHRFAVIPRNLSGNLSLVTFHHIAPLAWIADNDSQFCLWPDVEKACAILGLEFDPSIYENKLPVEMQNNLKIEWMPLLYDSIGIWEALAISTTRSQSAVSHVASTSTVFLT